MSEYDGGQAAIGGIENVMRGIGGALMVAAIIGFRKARTEGELRAAVTELARVANMVTDQLQGSTEALHAARQQIVQLEADLEDALEEVRELKQVRTR